MDVSFEKFYSNIFPLDVSRRYIKDGWKSERRLKEYEDKHLVLTNHILVLCLLACILPVHVDEKQVIPTNEIESDPSSTKRNQHHLWQKNPHKMLKYIFRKVYF